MGVDRVYILNEKEDKCVIEMKYKICERIQLKECDHVWEKL